MDAHHRLRVNIVLCHRPKCQFFWNSHRLLLVQEPYKVEFLLYPFLCTKNWIQHSIQSQQFSHRSSFHLHEQAIYSQAWGLYGLCCSREHMLLLSEGSSLFNLLISLLMVEENPFYLWVYIVFSAGHLVPTPFQELWISCSRICVWNSPHFNDPLTVEWLTHFSKLTKIFMKDAPC